MNFSDSNMPDFCVYSISSSHMRFGVTDADSLFFLTVMSKSFLSQFSVMEFEAELSVCLCTKNG